MGQKRRKTEQRMFTKQELRESKRFEGQKDLLGALLDENKTYSIQEAEEALNEFLKGDVKTWR